MAADRVRPPPAHRVLFLLALGVALLVAYWPALQGGWVWDDHAVMTDPARLLQPAAYFTKDVYSALADTDERGTIYRPLCYLSYVPDQWLAPGPFSAKLGNVLLHFAAAWLLLAIAEKLGAPRSAAALGALLFAFHPGASEPIAYAVCRHVTVPTVLLLGAWLALLARRDVLAGALTALTPFAGEYFLLAFVTLAVWMVAMRRLATRALAVSIGGLVAYFVVRELIGVSFWGDATGTSLQIVGALGGFAVRGFELLFVPLRTDIVFPFTPNVAVGVVTIVAVVALHALLPGRPAIAALVAPLWIMLPCALISAQISIVADRYYYVWFASLGIAVALALPRIPRAASWPLWLPVPALAYATWLRGFDWKDDVTLFESSLAQGRHARAAFFLGYLFHERGDCRTAIPYYEQAIAVDGRAGPDLQACLMELGRHAEAADLGPILVQQPRVRVTTYLNTARALAQLGRLEEAEEWARQATRVATNDLRGWVILGNVRGMRGDIEGARVAFETGARITPDDPEVRAGLQEVARAEERWRAQRESNP
jgi:protein O-mannosyl-transferase